MKPVIGHVEDRNVRPVSILTQHFVPGTVIRYFVFQNTDADTGDIASHHFSCILDGLAGLLLGLETPRRGGHELSVAAQFGRGGLKAQSRADRWVVKEHQEGLVFQNVRPTRREALALHLSRQVQQRHQLVQ